MLLAGASSGLSPWVGLSMMQNGSEVDLSTPASSHLLLPDHTSVRKVWMEQRWYARPGLDRPTATAIGLVSSQAAPRACIPYGGMVQFK